VLPLATAGVPVGYTALPMNPDGAPGGLVHYGQRINIDITLNGQGAAAGRSTQIVSGWMIRGDGSITLNTPFSGFGQ
jgi:hypothetical protein